MNVKATVELTKGEDGYWMHIAIGGRQVGLALDHISDGPMIRNILNDWAESHFLKGPTP